MLTSLLIRTMVGSDTNMKATHEMIAACGLDCGGCPIRTADTDAGSAKVLLGWFRSQGWLSADEGVAELMQRGPYCRGCHGDRSIHWSATCWILQCCIDDRKLTYCYECGVFPCERLSEWAGQSQAYARALHRLQSMKASKHPH
jgi:hypothetical protein